MLNQTDHEVDCQFSFLWPPGRLRLCCPGRRATARPLRAPNLLVVNPFLLPRDIFTDYLLSPANKNVDGRFLSLKNNTLGVFDGDDVSPVQVYPVESDKEGCNELHTYPVGIVDHSIGLMGPPGLLDLVDMTNPRTVQPGEGTVAQWDTFRISDGKLSNDVDGQWLAFPSQGNSWTLKWSDGK